MDTAKGDFLIAEFAGQYGLFEKGKADMGMVRKAAKYRSSWNCTMPVVRKIEYLWNPHNPDCIYDEHEYSNFEISSNFVQIETSGFKDGKHYKFSFYEEWDLLFSDRDEKLKHTVIGIIEFIQWYNQNIKTQKQV